MTPVVASSYNWLIDKTGHEIKPRPTNAAPGFLMRLTVQRNYTEKTPTNGEWAVGTVTDLRRGKHIFVT